MLNSFSILDQKNRVDLCLHQNNLSTAKQNSTTLPFHLPRRRVVIVMAIAMEKMLIIGMEMVMVMMMVIAVVKSIIMVIEVVMMMIMVISGVKMIVMKW